jgi:hypothetical protein
MSEQDIPPATSSVQWFREDPRQADHTGNATTGRIKSVDVGKLGHQSLVPRVEVVALSPEALAQLTDALRGVLDGLRAVGVVDNMSGVQQEVLDAVLNDVQATEPQRQRFLHPERETGETPIQLVDSATGAPLRQTPEFRPFGWVLCSTPGCSKRAGHPPPCDQLAPDIAVHRRQAMTEMAERRAAETSAMPTVSPIPPPSPGGNCPICQTPNGGHTDWCPRRPAT